MDPSVQAAPLYGQYSFNNNPNPPQQTFNQSHSQFNPPDQYNPPAQNYPSTVPQNQTAPKQGFASQNQSGFPNQNPGFQNQNSGFPSQNPGFPSQNQGFPSQNQGFPSQNQFDGQNPLVPNQSGPALNPGLNQGSLNNGYYGQQDQMAPAPVPKNVAPGWNDPPMLSSKPKVRLSYYINITAVIPKRGARVFELFIT